MLEVRTILAPLILACEIDVIWIAEEGHEEMSNR